MHPWLALSLYVKAMGVGVLQAAQFFRLGCMGRKATYSRGQATQKISPGGLGSVLLTCCVAAQSTEAGTADSAGMGPCFEEQTAHIDEPRAVWLAR